MTSFIVSHASQVHDFCLGLFLFLQDALKSLTGKATVPHVFIKGKFIGGGDETASLNASGKLQEILKNNSQNKED